MLKQHRIRRVDAATLRAKLRTPAVKLTPGAAEAATTHVRLVVERLVLVNRQLDQTRREGAARPAFGHVQHQAIVPPGIRMGDVAEADDGVVGADAASPVPEQVPFISSTLRNDRPRHGSTEGSDRCRSDQSQVRSGALATIGMSASAGRFTSISTRAFSKTESMDQHRLDVGLFQRQPVLSSNRPSLNQVTVSKPTGHRLSPGGRRWGGRTAVDTVRICYISHGGRVARSTTLAGRLPHKTKG